MRFIDILSIGITAIVGNKLHSLLTLIGIIIGIASVFVFMAERRGLKRCVASTVSRAILRSTQGCIVSPKTSSKTISANSAFIRFNLSLISYTIIIRNKSFWK